jgi:hypothetical protein
MFKIGKGERGDSRIASRDEVKDLIIQQDDVKDFRDFWPAVVSGISAKKAEGKTEVSFYRKWILAAASIGALILAGFLFYAIFLKTGTLLEREGEAGFRIHSIRVGEEPATPFVFQPKDSDMILVWAEKSM